MFRSVILSMLLLFSLFAGDFEKGLKAYNQGDYKTAIKLWKPLAKQGDPYAQYNLGLMYGNGRGVKQDYKEAVKWYTLAAKQGDPKAQYNLGVMYVSGKEVPQNKIKAYEWWLKAARQGEQKAQHNLDILCRQSPWACQK